MVFSGLLLGFVPTLDYPSLFYALIVFCGACVSFAASERLRNIILLTVSFLVPVGLMLAYHDAAFGKPFTTAYHFRAPSALYELLRAEAAAAGAFAFLPTFFKIGRSLFSQFCGIFWFHPLLLPAFAASIWFICKKENHLVWLGVASLFFANLFYFSSLPESVNPAAGSFGARYTVYSAAFAFFTLAPVG